MRRQNKTEATAAQGQNLRKAVEGALQFVKNRYHHIPLIFSELEQALHNATQDEREQVALCLLHEQIMFHAFQSCDSEALCLENIRRLLRNGH